MPEINVRPRKLRTVRRGLALVGFGALAAAIITTPAAKADPLNDTQTAYVLAFHGAVCKTIGAYPSEAGVAGVLSGVMDDGFGPVAAAQIVNASVAGWCPSFWPLLQAIGDRARAQDSISDVVAS